MKGRNKPRPSEVTSLKDSEWRNASLSERTLHVLRAQERLRVQEQPRGSNWGPKVSLYLKAVGWATPASWCAALLTWALLEAGADRKKLPLLAASTYWWWEWASKSGRLLKTAERGRFGVYNGAGGGHIWACVNSSDPHVSIEGNTNTDGSREGYGVFERERSVSVMRKYPRWGFIDITDDLFAS